MLPCVIRYVTIAHATVTMAEIVLPPKMKMLPAAEKVTAGNIVSKFTFLAIEKALKYQGFFFLRFGMDWLYCSFAHKNGKECRGNAYIKGFRGFFICTESGQNLFCQQPMQAFSRFCDLFSLCMNIQSVYKQAN